MTDVTALCYTYCTIRKEITFPSDTWCTHICQLKKKKSFFVHSFWETDITEFHSYLINLSGLLSHFKRGYPAYPLKNIHDPFGPIACFSLFSSGLAYWMWKRCSDQLEWACKQNQRIERVLQLTLCYWEPGNCRSMALFYYFFSDGREKRMNYKMIKKHFSTAAPWYTILWNINTVINHSFRLFRVLGSMFSTPCETGF